MAASEWEFISFTECENISSMELLKMRYKNLDYVPRMDSQALGKWTSKATDREFVQMRNHFICSHFLHWLDS